MTPEEQKMLIECDQRSKSNTHRIDTMEGIITSIHDLAAGMKVMTVRQEQMVDKVDKLDIKVEALEQKPAKRYEGIVEKIIWAVVAAVLTYILSHVGL